MPKKIVKKVRKHISTKHKPFLIVAAIVCFCLITSLVIIVSVLVRYENRYQDRIYPGVQISQHDFGGKTTADVVNYWLKRNQPFQNLTITLKYETYVSTISAANLNIGYDATISAIQAFSVGRTGNWASDWYHKYLALTKTINLKPLFRWDTEKLNNELKDLAAQIDIEPENALFDFKDGKVTAFKPSSPGQTLNISQAQKNFSDQIELLSSQSEIPNQLVLILPVIPREPLIKTEQANSFGIKDHLGRGESRFRGSIAGRVHNVALAASRINGTLIPPGQTFSFNATVGDISAATGYKQAYVIKSGRTVLDDGGGVCQVSTTLFRAALAAGLPIVERHAHSYRVGYYEQGGWKPGFDATVYDPSYDLKIQNDSSTYILIQANTDTAHTKLTFDLYGQSDNRTVSISPMRMWDAKPALPDLHQDDPTLPTGTVKQVDWAQTGLKTAFDYTVTRDSVELTKQTFFSNFIPWQAVYLHGTGPT